MPRRDPDLSRLILGLAVALVLALGAAFVKVRRSADSGAGAAAGVTPARLPTSVPQGSPWSGDGRGIVPGPPGTAEPGGSAARASAPAPAPASPPSASAAAIPGQAAGDGGAGGEAPGGTLADRLLGWYLSTKQNDLAPPGTDAAPVTFEVASGEGLSTVAARLAEAGLVRDAEAFRLLARVSGADTGVQAGKHTLRRNMTAEEVLRTLQVARADTVTLTLPEGWRAEEIASLLAQKGLAERGAFLRLVGAGRSSRPVLADRPPGTGLEGYLFPDTYRFAPNAGAERVLDTLLETFDARFSPEMRQAARSAGLSVYQVVTLASIVEREAVVPAERGKIARVYLNRLAAPPFILNADPTVQYALGFQPEANTWWKRPLSSADLKLDSAYNTYLRAGLPPGPIASPGLASLRAVLEPEPGDWQYFVANDVACDGTHVFAATYDAHLRNIAVYQKEGCRP